LHLLLIDHSGSMQRQGRLALAKGCAERLLAQAVRQGDEAGVLAFGGRAAVWLQAPGRARRAMAVRLRTLGSGGGTPLAQALQEAETTLQRRRRQGAPVEAWLWLLTDGRALHTPPRPRGIDQLVLVDHDDPLAPAGRGPQWARLWQASWLRARALA
jgi:magnesium chelatase subunit ChlD-like protein